ncbi:MAG: hypothetical protein M1832_006080 [Thelocarpon impressellum]|nr:MAG: hypothetical protein M1832_006080 [Thelocarpon impressellum]
MGLDLTKHVRENRLFYIDGLAFRKAHGELSMKRVGEVLTEELLRAGGRVSPAAGSSGDDEGGVALVLDGLDLLLALSEPETANPAVELAELLMRLREARYLLPLTSLPLQPPYLSIGLTFVLTHQQASSAILTLSADSPILHPSPTHPSPLATAHASFVAQAAHTAAYVISARSLDTGAARDVSGVLRVSVVDEPRGEALEEGDQVEQGEFLYHVGADGAARVFRRGE